MRLYFLKSQIRHLQFELLKVSIGTFIALNQNTKLEIECMWSGLQKVREKFVECYLTQHFSLRDSAMLWEIIGWNKSRYMTEVNFASRTVAQYLENIEIKAFVWPSMTLVCKMLSKVFCGTCSRCLESTIIPTIMSKV